MNTTTKLHIPPRHSDLSLRSRHSDLSLLLLQTKQSTVFQPTKIIRRCLRCKMENKPFYSGCLLCGAWQGEKYPSDVRQKFTAKRERGLFLR
jgi:hypothetical protein